MPFQADSDDSLSSDPIELPLPPLPGQSSNNNKAREAFHRIPADFDFGPSTSTFTSQSTPARRTPSPPLPSLTSQDQTVSDTWHDESTPTAPHTRLENTFYTAQWGSPYQLPRSKRTRFTPGNRGTFSSEESLLPALHRRASSPIEIDEEADPRFDLTLTRTNADQRTGRLSGKRTEDWLKAHIAHRRRGEKKNWWSDEGSDGSGEDPASTTITAGSRKRRGRKSEFDNTWLALREAANRSPSGSRSRSRSRSRSKERSRSAHASLHRSSGRLVSSRAHRAAPSDATLTQAQWNELITEEDEDEEEHADLPDINMLSALSSGMQGILPRRNMSKDLSASDKPLPPAPTERTASESPVGATRSPDPTKRPGLNGSASFQRTKKKVPWRGKTCVIALPLEDGKDESGAKKIYMSTSQVSDRMKQWEQKGYSTRGFDLFDNQNTYDGVKGQSRHIYPDPAEWRSEVKGRSFSVKVPNRAAWESYVRELQEEKLRKLGVLKDRPEDFARQSPAPSQAQMSRNGSSQNSRAPTAMSNAMGPSVNGFRGPFGDATFSPPSLTSGDGLQSRQSLISPVNQPGGFHAAKQSIAFLPGQGFVNLGFPQPQPTPPPAALNAQNLMNAQNLLASNPASRGPSPALMDLHNRRMSILTTPQPGAVHQILNQNNDSALLRQQQHQLQQSMLQSRQMGPPMGPPMRPPMQRMSSSRTDDMNGPAIYSQPSHIASPMPQGHKHNVSESLQREIDEAEYHLEESIRKQLEESDEKPEKKKPAGKPRSGTPEIDTKGKASDKVEAKAERIEADLATSASSLSSPTPQPAVISRNNSYQGHAKKLSMSKLRAAAPEFVFDPTKTFKPGGAFSFGSQSSSSQPLQPQQPPPQQQQQQQQQQQPLPRPQPQSQSQQQQFPALPSMPAPFQFGKKLTPSHSKSSSIASMLNVAAKEFVPGASRFAMPDTAFNFSSSVPGIKTDGATITPRRSAANSISSVAPSDSGSAERPGTKMFGNFNFADMVKPQRKSMAVPIIKPSTPPLEPELSVEETPGGGDRLDAKRREFREAKADADEIPKFAIPTPEPSLAEQTKVAQQQVKAATPEPPVLRSANTPPPEAETRVEETEGKATEVETVQEESSVPEQPVSISTPVPAVMPSQPAIQEKPEPQSEAVPEIVKEPKRSDDASHELQMPKVDTAIPSQPVIETIDWAETPLEGPFSRQNLDKAFAERSRQESIVEEPNAEVEVEEVARKPSPGHAAIPVVRSQEVEKGQPLISVEDVKPSKASEPVKTPVNQPETTETEIPKVEEPAKVPAVQPAVPAVLVAGSEDIPRVNDTQEISKSKPEHAAPTTVGPEELKPVEAVARIPTPKATSAAIPIIKPAEEPKGLKIEMPAKTPSPKPGSAAIPIVKPEEAKLFQPMFKSPEVFAMEQSVRRAEAEEANKKRKPSPEDKTASFNPTVASFNPGASTFVPSVAPTIFNFASAEPATPEQEWPEVQKQRIIKAPPKLGLQGRRVSGSTKGGLTGGGLLGTSRWAASANPDKTPSPKPSTQPSAKPPSAPLPDVQASAREPSPPARGRKSQLVRERSPAPVPALRVRERSPSPILSDVRKGFAFSNFGDRLAAARRTSPPREPSPPVRGRGKKGSATTALSRSPSPAAYNKGFNFSTYRDHQFAAPRSPPPPPRSPSLAYSPPPGTPTPPPVPERSPSRPPAQAQQPLQPEPVSAPVPEPIKRQQSQPGISSLRPRSPSLARSPSPALLRPEPLKVEGKSRDAVALMQRSPTYQEIDEVIKQLNGSDSDRYVERTPMVLSRAGSQGRSKGPSPEQQQLISLSPVQNALGALPEERPTSDINDLAKPFQFLPPEHDFGSSENEIAEIVQRSARYSPSFKPSRREDDMSPSRKMGHIAHRDSVSDWNDVLSSSDEAKFHARTRFFDTKANDEIGEIIQTRLRPLEQGLALLNKSLEQIQSERNSTRRGARSRSADLPSDADDEDDEQPRGLSPVKDRKFEKLRSVVVEAVNQQQQAPIPEIEQMMMAMAEMKMHMAQQAANAPVARDIDATIDEAIGRHMLKQTAALAAQDAAADDKLKAQIANLESQLKAAEQRANDEQKARQMAEEAVQGNQKLLRLAQDEASQHRESVEETDRSLKAFLDAQQESKQRMAMLEEAEEAMQNKVLQLSSKNEALEDTLEEYRISHEGMKTEIDALKLEKDRMNDGWNKDIEAGRAENDELQTTIEKLRGELEEGLQSRQKLKEKLDRLTEDMTEAVKNVTRDQANWRQKAEEHNARHELQSARLEAEARTRERLELEIDRLEKQEKEAMRARFLVEQIRGENLHLGSLVNELRGKNHEYQDATAAAKREIEAVQQRARSDIEAINQRARGEVERMSKVMNAEAENGRAQANIVRKDLEAVVARLEQQLGFAQQESNTAKSRFGEMLEEAGETKERSLREAAEAKEIALQDAYRFHERQLEEARQVHHDTMVSAAEDHKRSLEEMQEKHRRELDDLQVEHERAMRYANGDHKRLLDSAMEDKRMTENYLNGRLSLAEEKITHYSERVAHYEERLEIAKSAAQAAAAAAEAAKKAAKKETLRTPRASTASSIRPSMSISGASNVPDKISPQALRESIAVLQEQLHARETKVEELEQELEPLRALPEKVRQKDMEITFVRELLDVRMDDLQDIIRTLSQPQGFSRERVRDAVIRLRANLQMEQQERERAIVHSKDPSAPAPAPQLSLSGLRDIASNPRNVGLAAAAAWGNWRRGVSQPVASLVEMAVPAGTPSNGGTRTTDATPSRSSPSSILSGLLTPPASSARSTAPTPTVSNQRLAGQRRTSTASSARGGRSLSGYSTVKYPQHGRRPSLARAGASEENRHVMLSELPQPDTPPGLLSKGSYDQDAEDGVYSLDRYVNERDEDEQADETVIEEEEGDEQDMLEDGGRYAPQAGYEAVAVVDEPFGPVIGA